MPTITLFGTLAFLVVNRGFVDNLPLLATFILLGGACSSLIGLLVDLLIENPQTASGIAALIYLPMLWGGFFYTVGEPLKTIIRFTPTYYLVDGILHALFTHGTFASEAFGLVVLSACTLLALLGCLWALDRQQA